MAGRWGDNPSSELAKAKPLPLAAADAWAEYQETMDPSKLAHMHGGIAAWRSNRSAIKPPRIKSGARRSPRRDSPAKRSCPRRAARSRSGSRGARRPRHSMRRIEGTRSPASISASFPIQRRKRWERRRDEPGCVADRAGLDGRVDRAAGGAGSDRIIESCETCKGSRFLLSITRVLNSRIPRRSGLLALQCRASSEHP